MSPVAAILATAGLVNLLIWLFLFSQPRTDPAKSSFLFFVSMVVLGYGVEFAVLHLPEMPILVLAGGRGNALVRLSLLLWVVGGYSFLNFVCVLLERKRRGDPLCLGNGVISVFAACLVLFTDVWVSEVELGPWGATTLPTAMHVGIALVPGVAIFSGVALLHGEIRSRRVREQSKSLRKIGISSLALGCLFFGFKVLLPGIWGFAAGYQLVDCSLALFCLSSYGAILGTDMRGFGLERVAEQLFGNFGAGLILVDGSARVRYVNGQALRFLGREEPVPAGTWQSDLIPANLSSTLPNSLEFQVGEGENKRVLLLDGARRRSGGEDVGAVYLLHDITDEKIQEDRLKQRQDELHREIESYEKARKQAKKIEALSSLSSGIAHDFNNLLSVILGFAGAAREELGDNSLVTNDIDEIVLASRRAQNIVDQILTFKTFGEEKELRVVAVGDILEDVLSVCKSHIPSVFRVVKDEKQPHLAVKVDPSQLKQALLNLVLNAYQAMERGPGMIRIGVDRICVEERFATEHPPLESGDHVVIAVSDSGRGIPKEAIGRVFDPLYTTQDTAGGTGLGLPTALHICNEYGGTLTVDSALGQGTTVQVLLPSFDLPFTATSPLAPVERKGNERILIVDDEDQFVRLGRRILEPLGYDVTVHTDSISAWNAFWSNPDSFDLVITDHSMPRINGSELANEIAYIRPDMPIILVSGDAQAQVVAADEEIVFTEFLSKPIPSDVLGDTVRRLLDNDDF